MIDKFCEYFEGTFVNKMQAMMAPRDFAMIELVHTKIDTNKFNIVQQYFIDKLAYRNSVIEVIAQDNTIITKNYKDGGLTYLPGCDIIFEKIGEAFYGKNLCKDCIVTWSEKETYLQVESVLGNNYYNVIDKGYDITTDEHIWGSFHGSFQFVKSPL